MRKLIKFCKKYNWILIIVIGVLFIPQSFSYQAKINERVLVTGLAIDKSDEGYEITAQIVMPSAGSQSEGNNANLDFISEKGDSIVIGLQKIAYKIGKIAGLSHTNFIILGESMLEDNVVSVLDYFARDSQITPSVLLLFCEGSAKDTIKQTKNLELSVGVGLQKVFIYKQSSLNGLVMPIDEFINSSYSLSNSSTASGILISKEGEESSGQSSQANSSGGASSQNSASTASQSSGGSILLTGASSTNSSSSSSQQDSQSVRIKYYNDIFYFKNGQYVDKLATEDEILGYFLADVVSNNGQFYVDNVSINNLKDTIISGTFSHKKTRINIKFEDGKPVLVFNINVKNVKIQEILNHDRPNVDLYNLKDKSIIKATAEALEEKAKRCINATFTKAKEDNVDIFDIAEKAYQYKPKQWKKYYKEYGENYLKDCKVEVNVNIKSVT